MHYPNIRIMLQLACTLPVTSCECESSATTMHRLHTYMRTSLTQERRSSLALLHIHYDVTIDLDKAVDIYSRLHPVQGLHLACSTPPPISRPAYCELHHAEYERAPLIVKINY